MSEPVMSPKLTAPSMQALSPGRLARMAHAGDQVRAAAQALSRGGLNVVGECLRGQGTFYEMAHYPAGDVYDSQTGAQYYYHHHREMAEHGHFHLFVRPPLATAGAEPRFDVDSPPTHLIAISMDDYGAPLGLFATNRWVTDEKLLPATELPALIDRFSVEHANPNWAVNRWLTGMLALFQPQVLALLAHRDQVLAEQAAGRTAAEVLEDRHIEVTGEMPIDVDAQIETIETLLQASAER